MGDPNTISTHTHHHLVHQSVVGREAEGAPIAPRVVKSETPDTMSVVTAFAPLLTRTPQVWIQGRLRHATRRSCRVPVEVLVDTGAGGGNYTSLAFTKTVQTNLWGGRSIISSAGKGLLRAANPRNSRVCPMEVIGSCVISMVFSPVDRVFRLSFPIVRDLPYAVVLGSAFMNEHHSTVSFREKEGFSPTPESAWMPFSPHATRRRHRKTSLPLGHPSTLSDHPPTMTRNPMTRHVIPKCPAKANESSLDQVVDHLHSICWTIKERRRSHAAPVNARRNALRKMERRRQQVAAEAATAGTDTTPASAYQPPSNQRPGEESTIPTRRSHAAPVNARRNALRKMERRRQQAAAEAAIAGTDTTPASADQPPSNQRPGEESTIPTQTEADSPTTMDEAVWEDKGTFDWVLRLSNAVSSLSGGTSVIVDARVKGPQPQTRLLVIIEPREKFNLKRGVDIGIPRGIQWWERATRSNTKSRTWPPDRSPSPTEYLWPPCTASTTSTLRGSSLS